MLKILLLIIPKRKLPAIKIRRFAVDEKYSRKRLGSEILINILFNVNIAENNIRLRFVTVKDYETAYTFYIKHNFNNLKR